MRRLRFTSAAADDISNISAYVGDTSGSRMTADRFIHALMEQCGKLAALPGALGRPRAELRPGLRSFAFRGYVIYFQYLDQALEIVAILEGHRDAAALLGKEAE